MVDKYIKLSQALEVLDNCACWWAHERMEHIPAADVAPVRHGKWDFEVGMTIYRERNCPVCKKRIESNFWSYCPNCGADMREES